MTLTTKEKAMLLLSLLHKQGNSGKMITDSLLANGTIHKIRMDENRIEMVVETAVQLEISYKRLFKLLIDKDMTQRELSDQSGVSYLTLTKMRKGEGTINTVVWDKICRTLNCDVSDILEIVPYGSLGINVGLLNEKIIELNIYLFRCYEPHQLPLLIQFQQR